MCEMCDLKTEMDQIIYDLGLKREQFEHCVEGFRIAAKAGSQDQMLDYRLRSHQLLDLLFEGYQKGYRNSDRQRKLLSEGPSGDSSPTVN